MREPVKPKTPKIPEKPDAFDCRTHEVYLGEFETGAVTLDQYCELLRSVIGGLIPEGSLFEVYLETDHWEGGDSRYIVKHRPVNDKLRQASLDKYFKNDMLRYESAMEIHVGLMEDYLKNMKAWYEYKLKELS